MQETEQPVGDTSRYYSPASIFIVNPIRELVSGYIPVAIGNSIHWTYLFIVQYTYLDDVLPAGMAGSLITWDIFILNWLLDRYCHGSVEQLSGHRGELTLCLSYRFHISMISTCMMFTQLLRG
jgi:hypothetical protein